MKEFNKQNFLRKKFQVISTFSTEYSKDNYDNEFIAVMESYDYPIYVITYNIEMT